MLHYVTRTLQLWLAVVRNICQIITSILPYVTSSLFSGLVVTNLLSPGTQCDNF